MLKHRVQSQRSRSSVAWNGCRGSSSSSTSPSFPLSRNSSLSSLSSLESAEGDWGTIRVYTSNVRAFTDYKTLRVSSQQTVASLIHILIAKVKSSFRDPRLFELWMEVRTRREADVVCSLLKLEEDARPLELQRCVPPNSSRFILHTPHEGTLVRIHDDVINPQSNYKSLVLADETTCSEGVQLLLQGGPHEEEASSFGLALSSPQGMSPLAPATPLAALARRLPSDTNIKLISSTTSQ